MRKDLCQLSAMKLQVSSARSVFGHVAKLLFHINFSLFSFWFLQMKRNLDN